jgi:hypothetical protein
MMICSILFLFCSCTVLAFSPNTFTKQSESNTALDSVTRRTILTSTSIAFLAANPVLAFTQESYFLDEAPPTSQQVPRDKLDINSAFVGDYKQLRGMFPHAAGKTYIL